MRELRRTSGELATQICSAGLVRGGVWSSLATGEAVNGSPLGLALSLVPVRDCESIEAAIKRDFGPQGPTVGSCKGGEDSSNEVTWGMRHGVCKLIVMLSQPGPPGRRCLNLAKEARGLHPRQLFSQAPGWQSPMAPK